MATEASGIELAFRGLARGIAEADVSHQRAKALMAAVGRVACTGTVAAVDDEVRGIFKEVAPRVKSVAAELCLQQLVSEETGV
eukprot:4561094-Prorocentrum_lima.AAC.1